MKSLRKTIIFTILIFITSFFLRANIQTSIYTNLNINIEKPVKVAVFLFNSKDLYISLVKQNLEEIQKENINKVNFTFFDAKGNQTLQNESIDKVLEENNVDLLVVNLVDTRVDSIQNTINKIIQKNIPLVLYSEPNKDLTNFILPYNKAVFIGTDLEQSGDLEGKILVDIWNNDKSSIDKNGDNIMQYIMLHGKSDSPIAIARTKYSVASINNGGIQTQQLAIKFCEWDKELAKSSVESLFLNYGDKIEAIISNNDAMAIGAIEALQKYGYNKNDKTKYIKVVGIDAIPEAKELIKKGYMTGTVFQDPHATAEAIYSVGMNMVSNKYPLDGTDYKFDSSGIVIRLPYSEYIK